MFQPCEQTEGTAPSSPSSASGGAASKHDTHNEAHRPVVLWKKFCFFSLLIKFFLWLAWILVLSCLRELFRQTLTACLGMFAGCNRATVIPTSASALLVVTSSASSSRCIDSSCCWRSFSSNSVIALRVRSASTDTHLVHLVSKWAGKPINVLLVCSNPFSSSSTSPISPPHAALHRHRTVRVEPNRCSLCLLWKLPQQRWTPLFLCGN